MTQRSFLRSAATAVLVAVFAPAAAPQDLNLFERVLVPISVSGVPGAYGTVWSTELWYRNNSNRPVAIFPVAISDFAPTIGQTAFLPIGAFPAHAPGQVIYVSRNGGEDVQFDLRLFNRADPRGWGTKLPVVREREFRDALNLINVATGAEFRSAIRIYGLADDGSIAANGETVSLEIYSYAEQLLAETEMTLEGAPRYAAILSLADAFTEIRQVDRVRVHVKSRSPHVKIWAIVSIVANSTQNVELVTPD